MDAIQIGTNIKQFYLLVKQGYEPGSMADFSAARWQMIEATTRYPSSGSIASVNTPHLFDLFCL
jgi:hypothetical protein